MQAEQTSEAKIPTNRGFSLIQDCGRYNSSCGYCKEEDSSVSTGMHAHRLTVYDYQELLDQGWRRSGKFLYKPDNQTTCCRQYTIRLDVTEYQPAKAHRKLLRKWEHYLAGTPRQEQPAQQQQALSSPNPPGASDHDLDRHTASPKRPRKEGGSSSSTPQHQQQQQHHHHQQQQQQDLGSQAAQQLDEVRLLLQAAVTELDAAVSSGCNVSTQLLSAVKVLPVLPQQQQQQQQQKQHHKHRQPLQHGTCCSSPCALALAAAVRKHSSSMQQQAATGSNSSSSSVWLEPEQLADSLAGRFNSLAAQAQQPLGLTAAACKGHINFLVTQQQQQQAQQQDGGMQPPAAPQQQHQQHKLQQRKQHQQQPSASGQQQLPQQQQQQQEHVLEVRMVPNQFIEEEFVLWQRYQASQHHDPPDALTPKHYKGFLVDTPLIHVPPPTAAEPPGQQQQHQQQQQAAGRKQQAAAAAAAGGGSGMPSCGYGSFHQQYWLDGKLVAVGVVDVLPRCLSSKYFFWDPDYAHLSLGRYGALREISWIQSQHASGASDLSFYYLGYYIHTCPKMAYKAEYSPCELLCPQRQVWVRYDDTVRRALDNAPYVVLSDLPGVQMQPNLSVPRVPPASPKPVSPAQQGAGARLLGALGLGGAFASLGAAFTGSQGTDHTQQQQQEQQGLDVQLGLLGGAGVVSMPEHLSVEQQVQQRQRERQALDAQLLFVMRQPVRWAALRDSGMLDDQGITFMEERLTAWRAAVGETARTLLYAAAQDLI